MIRARFDRAAVTGERLLVPVLRAREIPQVDLGIGEPGIECNGTPEMLLCGRTLPPYGQHVTEGVVRLRVIRVVLQGRAEGHRRFFRAILIAQRYADIEMTLGPVRAQCDHPAKTLFGCRVVAKYSVD